MDSVKAGLQSIFHQYDDIQELFFQGDVSSFDINTHDSHGKTLLHHACEYGLTEGVSILLANNAQLDVCDEKGYTPLHCACQNNHIHYDICKIVIQRNPYLTLPLTQGGSGSGSTVAVVTSRDKCSKTILHYACIHGDFDIVDNLLKAGADPCAEDKLGNNPMHYACENGHLQCVRQLIVNSQNPNGLLQIPNNDGVTPLSIKTQRGGTILHMACENLDVSVAAKLLEAGADSNLSDVFGFTPLMRAVIPSKFYTSYTNSTTVITAIITALCNSKCNVNAMLVLCKLCSSDLNIQYSEGSTALHIATDNDRTAFLVINALIHNGAALDARDVHGRTPLHIASMRGHHHLIKLLAPSPGSFHFRDNIGCTPLYYACENSHLECVREFMVQIPDVVSDLLKVANKIGATPLSVQGDHDQTILHVACEKGDLSVVKKVLEAGADPNSLDGSTLTPLMLAVQHVDDVKAADIIAILCEFNCNVDIQTSPYSRSVTALHLACELGKEKCVEILLAKGANLLVRTQGGLTPLHLACEGGYHTLSSLITEQTLKAYDYKHWTPHQIECVRRIVVGFSQLLIQTHTKYNLTFHNLRDQDGRTILHHACLRNDVQFVENLLKLGADPNVLDDKGATPLISALRCHGSETDMNLLSLLLSQDWEPDIKDNSGRTGGLTPLHLACEGGYHTLSSLITEQTLKAYDYKHWTPHQIECVRRIVVGFSQLLIQTHTKYNLTFHNLRDQDGRTILHHACLRNDVQFVENLLKLGADPNVQDDKGATPLISALRCHGSETDMNLLSLLLSQDWEPDIKDNSGRTALHHSAKCDDIRIPLMLISAGCDVTAIDNNGQTYSDLIAKNSL